MNMTPAQALAAELRAEAARKIAAASYEVQHASEYLQGEADMCNSIAARLDALGDGWRGIESMPRDGGDVFVACFYDHGIAPDFGIGYWLVTSEEPTCRDSCGEWFKATHWMPAPAICPPTLPEPPK